jgi:hypothetical protein
MIIIWKGRGWMVVLTLVLISLTCDFMCGYITQNEDFFQESDFALPICFVISGIIIHFIVNYLKNKGQPKHDVNLLDTKIQTQIDNKFEHTLFFIPMEYYKYIFPAIGIGNIIRSLLE